MDLTICYRQGLRMPTCLYLMCVTSILVKVQPTTLGMELLLPSTFVTLLAVPIYTIYPAALYSFLILFLQRFLWWIQGDLESMPAGCSCHQWRFLLYYLHIHWISQLPSILRIFRYFPIFYISPHFKCHSILLIMCYLQFLIWDQLAPIIYRILFK